MLHGKPGTGKTSYIRYLIASVKKDVIFLPPNMATAITNPGLITILIDNPKSVFVSRVGELDDEFFADAKKVGVTAGASTPEWIISEVIEHLSKI